MDLQEASGSKTTVWQVAAGFDQRDYADAFLRFGLAFVGGQKQIATLSNVRPGDLLVLKRGKSSVVAVGKVADRGNGHYGRGDKHWLRDFDGWDLEAYVHVDWKLPKSDVPSDGLTMGTIKRIHGSGLLEAAISAFEHGQPVAAPATEPASTRSVPDSEILEFLVTEGLRPALAEELTGAFARVRLLAHYYREHCRWDDVREHEARTFLIAPLLLALGWAEQQMKIELGVKGGRIDMACFGRPYCRDTKGNPNNEDCVLIVETKGFSQGLMYAHDQAKNYADQFPSCRAVVVTNGYCFKTYNRSEGAFSSTPTAYLNLLDPRDRYPLDPERVAGSLDVLRALLPSSWR